MKITKQYLSGCTWCGGTGFIKHINIYAIDTNTICPVCNGSKTILVTETTETPDYEVKPT